MGAILRIAGLTRHFRVPGGVLRALDGLSLEVAEGETLGVVGESGCGKSTLARLVAGIDRPTSGDVVLGGLSVVRASRAERKRLARFCQMVFQDPFASLNPRLRAGDIVAEPLVVHGVGSRAQRRAEVARLLERVGLPHAYSRRFPHELSGGQRQRIGIARALASRPRVLVADEPVSALDVSVQAQILNLLADLRDELGLTLILVSHDLRVVEWMADRVMVMYLGRVVELGPSSAVFRSPKHPYTQALLASAPRIDAEPGRRPTGDQLLRGDVPSAIDPPGGCPFHPRCVLARQACVEAIPAGREAGPGHEVACFETHGDATPGLDARPAGDDVGLLGAGDDRE